MTNSNQSHVYTKENKNTLQRLIRAIALSKGQFALILVRCNHGQLREQMLENIRLITKDTNIREIFLNPLTTSLHSTIVSYLSLDNPAVLTDSLPSAVMVFGIESTIDLENLLTGINQARDIYAATFPFPVVFWLQDEVASLLSRLAPDFKSWAATTIKFEMAKADLIALIHQEEESLFAKVLEAGAETFLSNASLDLDPKSQHRHEIESARNDLLRLYGVQLTPGLEASLEFVLGRDKYANDQINGALANYQRSLALWQQETKRVAGWEGNSFLPPLCPQPTLPSSLIKQAIVLFHLGLCYHRMADLYQNSNSRYCEHALLRFKQCLEILEEVQREDLVAKFILPACEMLQRLQAWDDLKELAQESLHLHKTYGTPVQVAQNYGFLANVAASESNWVLAHELANTALSISEEATEISLRDALQRRRQESWYLLLIARTQRHLGECEEAINNLEWAKVVCELQHQPSLYLEILEELRSLYFFERHDYTQAFKLKQEKIQIEHQYGFHAFIGLSRFEP